MGLLIYAELEPRKDKKISITAPDMTGVLYSEIKTDEVSIVDTTQDGRNYSHLFFLFVFFKLPLLDHGCIKYV